MPKFYVSSGELQIVLDRENVNEAVVDALKYAIDNGIKRLGAITHISEVGFKINSQKNHEDDVFFKTSHLLKEIDPNNPYCEENQNE